MGADLSCYFVESVVGLLGIETSEDCLVRVYPLTSGDGLYWSRKWSETINRVLLNQISSCDLTVKIQGTEFQKRVWKQTMKIPYGQTKTYYEIAQLLNKKKAYRAVGQALNQNPLLIFIPCHRVISKTGELTGFAAGVDMKKKLLEFEEKNRFSRVAAEKA